ncbi:CHAT domain-containing protein [Biscogniauxia marginata]|nr:CHAT domain-containing protein [Biscogniauxia marginata]
MQLIPTGLDELSSTIQDVPVQDIIGANPYAAGKMPTRPSGRTSELLPRSPNMQAEMYTQTSFVWDTRKRVMESETTTSMIPSSHSHNASLLNNLGYILAWSYERSGDLGFLQEAILRTEEALDMTPHDHPSQPGRLNNLGNWLGRRFERTGAMDDLQRAISQAIKAVQSTPPDNPCLASRLSSLGNWLARRHERTSSLQDLEHAIILAEEAVNIAIRCSQPNRAPYLVSLGNILALRYKQTRNPADILLAIFVVEQAVVYTPANHPDRTNWLSNLGMMLAWKYEQTGALDDLQLAILRTEEALEAMPDNHPNGAASLSSLGDMLYCRYNRAQATKNRECQREKDYRDCLSYYEASWSCSNGPSAVRVRAAYKAARILLNLRRWEESITLLNQAVLMLPRIGPYNLKQRDQQHMLKDFAGLATLAASAALLGEKGPVQALQLLELGRGVIASLRFGVGSDPITLKKQHPESVERIERFENNHGFSRPSILLSLAGEDGMAIKSLEPRQHSATVHLEKVVDGRCQQSSLGGFLLTPAENELKTAASGGPVIVINVSPVHCDALLVELDAIRSIPLPSLHHKDIAEKAGILKLIQCSLKSPIQAKIDMLSLILEWLWDVVASPVLEELGFREPPADNKWPRVWWVPTGLLSLFPLHAAGYHRSVLSETVLDRVVSSYSPSIKALLYAQKQPVGFHVVPEDILLVSMEKTPGCPHLDKARDEINVVEQLSRASAIKTKLENPCKGDVIDGLRHCDVFHFAGHSMPDPVDPSKSRLVLTDWQESPLTVEDLINMEGRDSHPFLAYLSACSTGANSAEGLHDESINLMTACQMAGFRHIIGSLWDVYDEYSVDAAREFYKALGHSGVTDDRSVAWGVHLAARRIRELTVDRGGSVCGEDNPLAWAAYIHMGP